MTKLDLMKAKNYDLPSIVSLAHALLSRRGCLILGVSAGWRYRLTYFLYKFNRLKLGKTCLFVMGGQIPSNKNYIKMLGCYKHIFVETESMSDSFSRLGIKNVSIYPNCREKPKKKIEIKPSEGVELTAVFFSLISVDKGVDIILQAAQMLPDVHFHFYGSIDGECEDRFLECISQSENIHYHGIFNSVNDNAIEELNKYDVHLFPTLCENEGVPGVIAETKMAGIPTIASNRSHNAELISDGVDGILTYDDDPAELAEVLRKLKRDSQLLDALKQGALAASSRYDIECYMPRIVHEITGVGF
ncbi:glycosyltransferase family 4 protein [Slackia heliotrinireducens]|uniref:glycosyltransferase family 4 protein n=1 Tax=Slackia heliotrinireducens TaxID=84110 RepID=UPI0033152382